jgi:hypothetical protein
MTLLIIDGGEKSDGRKLGGHLFGTTAVFQNDDSRHKSKSVIE